MGPVPALPPASSAVPLWQVLSLPRGLPATWSTLAMLSRLPGPAATGHPSRSMTLPGELSAIPVSRCKSVLVMLGLVNVQRMRSASDPGSTGLK